MSSVLGKRKARATKPTKPSKPSVSEEDAQEIFRRHFEAQFKPLPPSKKPKAQVEEDEEEDTDDEILNDDDAADSDEWGGVSDAEQDDSTAVEVVDHSASKPLDPSASMSKRELKAFMSSRPPSATSTTTSSTKQQPSADADSDPETEATLRAQDLELQRLLNESHLLSSLNPTTATTSSASQKPFASGKLRHKTTDLRIQNLAAAGAPLNKKASESLFDQKKMPMAMRKRLVAKQTGREEKRRREARENGIVLEKERKKPKTDGRSKRERSMDGPSVGKMRGAELKLSERDVMRIEGGSGGNGRGGRGGRGGGRGGRR